MGSSKRSRSRSNEASRSRSHSHRRSKKHCSNEKHSDDDHVQRVANSGSAEALNQLLDKVSQISASMESFNTRLSVLETNQAHQTTSSHSMHHSPEMARELDGHEQGASDCSDQLSTTVPTDHDLEGTSPRHMDTHEGHEDGPTMSKSLDPVNGEKISPLENSLEKPQLFNPTAEAPSWAPSATFKEFLATNFRRGLSSTQIFSILEETALPDMDIFTTPKLDKSMADQISPNYRKTADNRDKELSKVQRHVLNVAAPLAVLHDLIENKQTLSNEEILSMIEKSLCLLGNASNSVSVLRRSKILYAINPNKISLAESAYPNAGSLLFGSDINKLAADSADIARNLQKNLSSRQSSTQATYSAQKTHQLPKYQSKNEKFRTQAAPYGSNKYSRGATKGRFRHQGQVFRQQSFRNNTSFNTSH